MKKLKNIFIYYSINMTSSNLKNFNTNKEVKKSLSQKDSHFIEFNKKLEDFISDIKPKSSPTETNLKENSDSLKSSKKPHNPAQGNNISNQEKNSSLNVIQENNINSPQYSKALCRINFGKLMDCDQFAENYILEPYMNFDSNNDNDFEVPYSKSFEDNLFAKDESLFFMCEKDTKNQFLTKDDMRKIKKEEIKLNFGQDPFEIFKQISEEKILPTDKTSIEFYNSLNNFNIFRSRDPGFMNIKINNENNDNGEECFNMVNNDNFNYINDFEENYENLQNYSMNSTRQNSKTNHINTNIMMNEKDILLNNENFFKNYEKGSENNMDNKYTGKKRKK